MQTLKIDFIYINDAIICEITPIAG